MYNMFTLVLIFYVTQIWAGIIVVIIAGRQSVATYNSRKKTTSFFYTIEVTLTPVNNSVKPLNSSKPKYG